MLIKFLLNISSENLSNSLVVIYSSKLGIFFSTSLIFVLKAVLVTISNPLTCGILPSTSPGFVLQAELMTNPLTFSIVFTTFAVFFYSSQF